MVRLCFDGAEEGTVCVSFETHSKRTVFWILIEMRWYFSISQKSFCKYMFEDSEREKYFEDKNSAC